MAEEVYYEGTPSSKILVEWTFTKLIPYTLLLGFVLSYLFTWKLGFERFSFNIIFGMILSGFLIFIYLIFLKMTYKYKITDGGAYFVGGIIVKKQKFTPSYKITNTIVSQNILERILGISKVGVQTAGTGQRRPEIVFEGLIDPEKPNKLLRSLIEKVQGSPRTRYYSE